MEWELIVRVLRALSAHGVAYKVVGGVALNLQGLARATVDLDLFLEPTVDNVERLKAALRATFDDPTVDDISTEEFLGAYPAIQYVPPTGVFHIDLLQRLGEAFSYADIETESVRVEGLEVLVATPRMLHRMKRDTARPQDRADAARLAEAFDLDDDI